MTIFKKLRALRLVSKEVLGKLEFRAMWHCPTCEEQHDRNIYGRLLAEGVSRGKTKSN